jgi:hypothetical protein
MNSTESNEETYRICGTPGCTLKDFHCGPCNNTSVKQGEKRKAEPPKRHEPVDFKIHKPTNKFQLSKESLGALVGNNVGVTITTHTKFLNGEWTDDSGNFYDFDAKLVDFQVLQSNKFCLLAKCNEGVLCELTPQIVLNFDTRVTWNPPPADFLSQHVAEIKKSKENAESMRRASEFAYTYFKSCNSSPDDIILTLDGNGENRLGMQERFEELGIAEAQWPTIITFEVDAEVALSQRLLFGNNVVYTGSDSEFSGKRFQKGKTLLEDLIFGNNRLLTDDMKARVKAVYFDYCGGPPENGQPAKCRQNFATKIFPKLANLKLFGLTLSHRHHFKLQETFEQYVAIPHNFSLVETFLDNKKVVCKMYAIRDSSSFTDTESIPPKRKTIKCSKCGGVGHSKRTCTVVDISTSPPSENECSGVEEDATSQKSLVVPSNEDGLCEERLNLQTLKSLFNDGLVPATVYESKVSEILTKIGI